MTSKEQQVLAQLVRDTQLMREEIAGISSKVNALIGDGDITELSAALDSILEKQEPQQ